MTQGSGHGGNHSHLSNDLIYGKYVWRKRNRKASKFRSTRVGTHSDPERDDGSEDDGGQEVDGELVVACGNAPEVLEATEGSFDPPAIAVAPLVEPDRSFG
jgi:hypothetical protein